VDETAGNGACVGLHRFVVPGMLDRMTVVIPEWTFADRLRKARQSVDLNQRDFAERLGVGAPAYGQWEAGNNRPRDLVALAKRVELLTKVPAAWLLDLGPTPASTESWAPDGRSKPRSVEGWAPWGSNPQPAGYESVPVARVLQLRHRKPLGYVSDLVRSA
jgi:transcriptional regulator with XRE-family HTH domain